MRSPLSCAPFESNCWCWCLVGDVFDGTLVMEGAGGWAPGGFGGLFEGVASGRGCCWATGRRDTGRGPRRGLQGTA
jgi:hypothetical protein